MAILQHSGRFALGMLAVVAALSGCSDPMEHSHCEDTEIKRVKSPNGKLVAVVYNRSCSAGTGLYTYAEVEEPRGFSIWRNHHPQVCFVVTLAGGYHQLDVAWKDDTHIDVSSNDELDRQRDISSQESHCNGIELSYHFKFAAPPLDQAPDQETIDAISTAISEMQNCFDAHAHPERSERLQSFMKDRQHGDALEWLCTYMIEEHCPPPANVSSLIQQAADKMHRTKMSCYQIEERSKR